MVFRDAGPPCPRCAVALEAIRTPANRYRRCPACRGIMVEYSQLVVMLAEVGVQLGRVYAIVDPRRPIACPECRAAMAVRIIEGVEVDLCDDHGAWFDGGELSETLTRLVGA
jgi:Zn-finger nucleic acid-binding protein